MKADRVFQGLAYIESLREHYPELVAGLALDSVDERFHIGFVKNWVANEGVVGVDSPTRFQRMSERAFTAKYDAWLTSFDRSPEGLRRVAASSTYKGLLNLKPPGDLVLYSNLIWELQPATLIEFGALQGGSSLWFADQLEVSGGGGEVHSFEILDRCIHPSARHPRLHFHRADLRDITTLDRQLFADLPHPWLVVDDAHENLEQLMPFVSRYLRSGDYYVVEDALQRPTPEVVGKAVMIGDMLGFVVDTKYTDAFGYNVTCSPNAWLKKV